MQASFAAAPPIPPPAPTVVKETLGTKLRRKAADASINNPLTATPWTAPVAWVASTAYVQGQLVTNNGNMYVCITSGTSASSGGPTTTNGSAQSDGSAAWGFYSSATPASSDSNAPTLTLSSSTPSGLTNLYNPNTFPTFYTVRGGSATTYATSYWQMIGFNRSANSPWSVGISIDMIIDAPKFAIGFTNGVSPVAVIINGRYYSQGGIVQTQSGTPNWATFDFSSTLGKKRYKVTLQFYNSGQPTFAGVRVGPNDTMIPLPTSDIVNAVFISDSIYAGSSYGPFIPGRTAPQRIAASLGWENPTNMSQGGTGYINVGSGPYYNYPQRVADTANAAQITNANIIVLFGSTNDIGQSGIATAVTSTLSAIRSLNATAPIVVFGLWSINNAGVSATETAVQSGVTAFADPAAKTFFIPMYAAIPMPVVTGSWNNSANTGSTNSGLYINTGDNTHPEDIGTSYLGDWQADAILAQVLPYIQ